MSDCSNACDAVNINSWSQPCSRTKLTDTSATWVLCVMQGNLTRDLHSSSTGLLAAPTCSTCFFLLPSRSRPCFRSAYPSTCCTLVSNITMLPLSDVTGNLLATSRVPSLTQPFIKAMILSDRLIGCSTISRSIPHPSSLALCKSLRELLKPPIRYPAIPSNSSEHFDFVVHHTCHRAPRSSFKR